ncbi:hypothetical protein BB31_42735 [Amycolatopsis lurida NRRL 2430]|uniref:HTH luxR-type domain-containing protein n=1 Tax=Amycolatopsis lurida NRRL 2430 TaxID=1460371 RepID=A0A2P2FET4_AMYLU|nr:hypothetical protein BB31_42735 [Amycolatopsis lurida NRRL 2430]
MSIHGNLPIEVTSFVGRDSELAELSRLLSTGRLLTLVGPVGVGKTRLAVRAAREAADRFPGGVCMVRLDVVEDAGLLPRVVAAQLGLNGATKDPVVQVIDFLQSRSMLLLMDNCEHLVDACAEFVETLLQSTASVCVLATSRQVLDVNGEQLLSVQPLAVQGVGAPRSGSRGDAVALFEERLKSCVGKSFGSAQDRELVTKICYALDGIPLAIELAVPWLRVITLAEMAERLKDCFRLLAKSNRSGPLRHRTFASAVDWSYQLCTPAEARLWSRLSVFVDGFTLHAAEAVCVEACEDVDLLDLFSGLADKSILIRDVDHGVARYRMLETLRQFGVHKLLEAGESAAVQRRHAEFFGDMVHRLSAAWLGPHQLEVIAEVQQERGNLGAAFEFYLRIPEASVRGARIAVDLEFYWVHCGYFGEGLHWIDRVLALPELPADLRIHAMLIRVYAATALGDAEATAAMAAEAVAQARDLEDPVALGNALLAQGGSALVRTKYSLAEAAYVECLACYEGAGLVNCNVILAYAARGMVAGFSGQLGLTEDLARRAIAIADEHGEQCIRANALYTLALAEWQLGRIADALRDARQGLMLKSKFGDLLGQVMIVELCAWIASAMGNALVCAKLLGVAHRLWLRAGGATMLDSETWRAPHRDCELAARRSLDSVQFEAAFAEGAAQAIDLRHAVTFVLATSAASPKAALAASESVLTRREEQIAELIVRGETNKAIAVDLAISRRTVEAHVQHILAKLGFESRTQIGVWVVERRNKLA